MKVCGLPRMWMVAALGVSGLLLLRHSRALLTLAWALLTGKPYSCGCSGSYIGIIGQISSNRYRCTLIQP